MENTEGRRGTESRFIRAKFKEGVTSRLVRDTNLFFNFYSNISFLRILISSNPLFLLFLVG